MSVSFCSMCARHIASRARRGSDLSFSPFTNNNGNAAQMQPITMMRNALGREEGGSGVPLDRCAFAGVVVVVLAA